MIGLDPSEVLSASALLSSMITSLPSSIIIIISELAAQITSCSFWLVGVSSFFLVWNTHSSAHHSHRLALGSRYDHRNCMLTVSATLRPRSHLVAGQCVTKRRSCEAFDENNFLSSSYHLCSSILSPSPSQDSSQDTAAESLVLRTWCCS